MRTGWLGVALTVMTATAAAAQSSEPFYAGKTLNLVVGISAGGGYDQYARLLARHWSRHIPGTPTIVVRNMPGAGSLTAVSYVDSVAQPDGTTVGTFNAGLLNDSMGEGENAKIKFNNVAWLGSMSRDFRICYAWTGANLKTWRDLVARKETVFGAAGVNSNSANGVAMLRNIFALNIRTIAAYPGNTEMNLAVERGEVHGSCISWSSLPENWISGKKIDVLVRLSRTTVPEIPPDVPFIGDIATTQEQRDIIEVLLASGELGRPFILSNKVPADRVQTLRRSFDAALADEQLLAEAAKQGLAISPVSGQDAEKIVAKLYGFSRELVDKANDVLKK